MYKACCGFVECRYWYLTWKRWRSFAFVIHIINALYVINEWGVGIALWLVTVSLVRDLFQSVMVFISESFDIAETKAYFEHYFSILYFLFHESFTNVEINLGQRGNLFPFLKYCILINEFRRFVDLLCCNLYCVRAVPFFH